METMRFPRPRVVVSQCLAFEPCRYDGQMMTADVVHALRDYVDFQPVCPEVAIGLGIPRAPVRVVATDAARLLYQPATGQDFGAAMTAYVTRFLDGLTGIDGFILKSRSPSCGQGDVKIYAGIVDVEPTHRGHGFFGGAVRERFAGWPMTDDDRLKDALLREHFLTQLFACARLREAQQQGDIAALMAFQTDYKLLLMGYHQAQMRRMGKLLANHEQADLPTVAARYADHLRSALAQPPHAGAMINVLMHALGGFRDALTADEKRLFLHSLEAYRGARMPLSALLHTLRAWAIRHDNRYLLQQALLRPYPEQLVAVINSPFYI